MGCYLNSYVCKGSGANTFGNIVYPTFSFSFLLLRLFNSYMFYGKLYVEKHRLEMGRGGCTGVDSCLTSSENLNLLIDNHCTLSPC